MRRRHCDNLDSIQMYMRKGQKVHVYVMRGEMKVLKRASMGNEVLEMHSWIVQESFMYVCISSVTSHHSILQWPQQWFFFLPPSRQERIQWTHTLWLPNAWSCNPLLTWVVPLIAVGLLMCVGLLVDGLVWPRIYGFELGVGFAKDNNLPLW